MRYIPQSCYSFEEICKQCSDAINRPSNDTQDTDDLYTEVRHYFRYSDALSAVQ